MENMNYTGPKLARNIHLVNLVTHFSIPTHSLNKLYPLVTKFVTFQDNVYFSMNNSDVEYQNRKPIIAFQNLHNLSKFVIKVGPIWFIFSI